MDLKTQYVKNRWDLLAAQLGLSEDNNVFAYLRHMYSEPHRYYHTLEHIYYLLEAQERYFPDAPDHAVLAIFFHDVFYLPGFAENEEYSARIMYNLLPLYGIQDILLVSPYQYILNTKNHATNPKTNPFGSIVCDLDLMGLGGPPEAYDANTAKIRKEFSMFSNEDWIHGRRAFLTERLRRVEENEEPIFKTKIMFDEYEAKAIANMKRELEQYKE